MGTIKQIIVEILETNAARAVGWFTAAVVGAVGAADALIPQVDLSTQFMAGLAVFAGVVATEAIRLLVWSLRSVQETAAEAFEAGIEVGKNG